MFYTNKLISSYLTRKPFIIEYKGKPPLFTRLDLFAQYEFNAVPNHGNQLKVRSTVNY